VVIYDSAEVREAAASPETRKEIMAEWVESLTDGPGVMVFRKAFANLAPVDAANAFLGDDRGGAQDKNRRRGSFRQAGRKRPHPERPRKAMPT
jgi:hypothetical protein